MPGDSYLRDLVPSVEPDLDDRAWWDACRERRLTVPTCAACGASQFPITPVCPACHAPGMVLREVSGRGRIFSYTVQYHPPSRELAAVCPFNIAIVELDDPDGTHMLSNIVDAAPEELAVGLPVEVTWEEIANEITVPRFRITGDV